MKNKKGQFWLGLLLAGCFLCLYPALTRAEDISSLQDDYNYYQKYLLYLNYQKKQLYQNYKAYAKVKKYCLKSKDLGKYQINHDNYALYRSDSTTYAQYKKLSKDWKKYENHINRCAPLLSYAGYKDYKKYDKKKYDAGKNYGSDEYKAGYDRYVAAQGGEVDMGEADLGGGYIGTEGVYLGPLMTVGLEKYSRNDLNDSSEALCIKAYNAQSNDRIDYAIKNSDGETLATVSKNEDDCTKVRYTSDRKFEIYNSLTTPLTVRTEVRFEAANDSDKAEAVFKFNRPDSDYDKFRGTLRVRFAELGEDDEIWVINALPLEQYVWGMGEITGTGPKEHTKVMTTMFRTYGYWKMKFSNKYITQGFKVNATPGNQLYYGFKWEQDHENIKKYALETNGKLVMYEESGKNEIALTPYSSWSDGRTRSFKERWGSDDYPWCQSVKDPYGKNSSMSTSELEASGNHMVGLIAHGSLNLADDHDWKWDKIIQYYFHNINLLQAY